jgi:hypothetical protein
MPLQATSGAASYDAFGGGVPVVPAYIEDVFSTFLYTGQGSTNSYVNGIDLAGKGGLVWIKARSGTYGTAFHGLWDTARGTGKYIGSNTTAAQSGNSGDLLSAFNSDGFTVNTTYLGGTNETTNASAQTYASWTFRKQPKFFDVVTFTQSGTSGYQTINHNLGSTPGVIIIKGVGQADGWFVYHRSIPTKVIYLNQTDAAANFTLSNSVTSTTFNFNLTDFGFGNGATYVAYLFAHDAGGFGLTGTDNVISCGTFTADGSANFSVTLGYEPQFVMCKSTNNSGPWFMLDTMRGYNLDTTNGDQYLMANSSNAEAAGELGSPTATGFVGPAGNVSTTYIYIAIRRGPMKVPTSGTSVFAPVLNTGTGANTNISSGGFAPDMLWNKTTDHAYGTEVWDKLRGVTKILTTSSTAAEGTSPANTDLVSFNNTGVTEGPNSGSVMNITSWLYVNYMFGRAPSFFDEVCYTGNSTSGRAINHNLTVVPQLMIVKNRTNSADWAVFSYFNDQYLLLNLTNAASGLGLTANSTTFNVGSGTTNNASGDNYVAYLFATCAGVSKVGSYTGTATTLQIDCGFTAGARFVLIKRTDSTGAWYVWDSARGIVSGNDPYLLLNSDVAEVTNTDYVDTYSAGFEISSTAPAAINASGGTFVFLAIA